MRCQNCGAEKLVDMCALLCDDLAKMDGCITTGSQGKAQVAKHCTRLITPSSRMTFPAPPWCPAEAAPRNHGISVCLSSTEAMLYGSHGVCYLGSFGGCLMRLQPRQLVLSQVTVATTSKPTQGTRLILARTFIAFTKCPTEPCTCVCGR
jgi:hypothetical protein